MYRYSGVLIVALIWPFTSRDWAKRKCNLFPGMSAELLGSTGTTRSAKIEVHDPKNHSWYWNFSTLRFKSPQHSIGRHPRLSPSASRLCPHQPLPLNLPPGDLAALHHQIVRQHHPVASPAHPTQYLVDIHYPATGAFESVADFPAFEEATFVAVGIALEVSTSGDLHILVRMVPVEYG